MATRLVCDIDGSAGEDVRKVTFAVDGTPYEIDLSAASLAKLSKALEPWTAKARNLATAPSKRMTAPKSGTKSAALKPDYDKAAFKLWATEQGKWTGKRPADALIAEFLALPK